MRENQTHPPFIMDVNQRKVVEEAVREVCRFREYDMYAVNPRSNDAHAVVSAQIEPELITNTFKSYATRKLRESGLVEPERKIWARGRSRRYLWHRNHVDAAIDYVLYCQGDVDFEDYYAERFDD